MTSEQRAAQLKEVSDEILEFLGQRDSSVGAGTLIREYCNETSVDPTVAETALLLLLNKGSIITNHDLKLEKGSAEAA